ncbi:hypothetical protein DD549_15825 [Shewanella algae]|nr:hypothetical protein DD549_15825 [Shewanella algae]
MSFSVTEDLVNYSITISRRVVLPGVVAVWLDILKAEVCATTGAEYEALCTQARLRFNQVSPPGCSTFSDYARARYTLKGGDSLQDFDHWFERFTEYDNFNPVEGDKQPQYPKPLHTFRHRKRIRIEQQKAARANQKPGRKGRKPDPSAYWGWMEPYETYQEFARADRPRFVMVVNNGLDIMEQKFDIKFTREFILERAKYCRSKREFSLNNTGLMVIAKKLGLQNELIQMLECVPGRRFLLDKEQVTEPDPELDTLIEQVSTDLAQIRHSQSPPPLQ